MSQPELTAAEVESIARRTHQLWRERMSARNREQRRRCQAPPAWEDLSEETRQSYRLLVAFVEGWVSEELRARAAKGGAA